MTSSKRINRTTRRSQGPAATGLAGCYLAKEPIWEIDEDPVGFALEAAQTFDGAARKCRQRGRFQDNPIYHVAVSWRDGERPTGDHARRTCGQVIEALGLGECQVVWSIHRDIDHHHVHLVVNRVHPTKLTVNVPRRDYFLLDRCMRELDQELGFGRGRGPFVTVDTADGPQIVHMT